VRSRFAARYGEEREPPPPIAAAIEAIVRLLSGKAEDLSGISIELAGASEFERQVYAAACAIPPGETRTYGELAAEIGAPDAARAVGHALGRNPLPIIVPCHRILASGGRSGGFSAPGGTTTKLRMLEIEGARRGADPGLFEKLPWAMKPAAP
jgi:methylated-DNA-[protein]-cysteine S-methyltransferase